MAEKMLKFVSLSRQAGDKRAADERRHDFHEIQNELAIPNAARQSSRCSQCGVPFCQTGCPLHNAIPDWLALAAEGRLEEAWQLSSSTNNFPEICGRICPQDRLCEGNCVIEKGFDSVTIGAVERYITDTAFEKGWVKAIRPVRERAESIGIIGAGPGGLAAAEELRAALDGTWKTVLLNQFHDILPGSSIKEVYDDARVQMDGVRADAMRAIQRGMAWLAERVAAGAGAADAARGADRLVVFNPASTPQSGTLATEDGHVMAVRVPPLGIRVIEPAKAPRPDERDAARVEGGRTLCNGFLRATIDDAGRIAELRRADDGRLANACDAHGTPLPMNQLAIYVDRPRRWEAWDIDRDYQEQVTRVMSHAERIVAERSGPLAAEIVVERALGKASRIVQRYRLVAGSPRLDIVTDVEWHEEQVLLRALFPCGVRTRRATFGIQFGHIERATHDNTTWERAQFEVPGLLRSGRVLCSGQATARRVRSCGSTQKSAKHFMRAAATATAGADCNSRSRRR